MKVYLGGSLVNGENRARASHKKSNANEENNLEGGSENSDNKSSKKQSKQNKKLEKSDSEVNLNNRNISNSPTKLSNVFKLTYPSQKAKAEDSNSSQNSKSDELNSSKLKSEKLNVTQAFKPEDVAPSQIPELEISNSLESPKPEELKRPHKIKFEDPNRPQRPKSENLNSLNVRQLEKEILKRSKSESCLAADPTTSLRKKVAQRCLSRENDEKNMTNILEDFMKLQAQRDPIIRKMFERNSRQVYKEKLCQNARLNLQLRSQNKSCNNLGEYGKPFHASVSQICLSRMQEDPTSQNAKERLGQKQNFQGISMNKSCINLGECGAFHKSTTQMCLTSLQDNSVPQSPKERLCQSSSLNISGLSPHKSCINLGECYGSSIRKSTSQMCLNRMTENKVPKNAKESFEEWQKRRKQWIGVNGARDRHHHHHPLSTSSIDVGSPHYRNDSAPQTPHIIVSPECDSQEPFFIYPEGRIYGDKQDSQEENDEGKRLSTSPEGTYNEDKEAGATSGNQNSFSPDSPTKTDSDSPRKENTCISMDAPPKKSANKASSYLQYSADSSSSNSPEEDRGNTFFGNELAVVDRNVALDYCSQRCNTLPHSKNDNNLPVVRSFHRSLSVVSLDPSDPFSRKTRKNSMMDIMRRVSSQSGLELRPPMERAMSRVSLVTLNNSSSNDWHQQMNDSLILCISALYAKLLVVMGMAFPMAEIISNDVPLILYHSFYLYLYFGSILFLFYAYIFLLRTKTISSNAIKNQVQSLKMKIPRLEVNWSAMPKPIRNAMPKKKKDPDVKPDKDDKISVATSAYKSPKYTITETNNHGSMYLKMGAVLFGIGSMIYSGLEFGQYFELRSTADCANILMAISPIARMIFTFLQMYFIFLNSRVAISKHTTIARFGFMHMIGTNLCIWLNVLVQETKHEIAHLTYSADEHRADLFPGHSVESHSKENAVVLADHSPVHAPEIGGHAVINSLYNKSSEHNIVRRGAPQADDLDGCRRINLMGNVVNSASPFLFPCTIEYSLLCAGVLYVMWKNINVNRNEKNSADGDSDISTFIARKVRHHYSVDCARASRGLFTGIFILVLTIISLILFYVLISNEHFKSFAILEANIIELSIYSLSIISVIVGMKQMRELEFILEGDIELDNILLIIAQAGVYIYASFTIIGGYFSLQPSHTLPLMTAILTLIQTTLQTLFILDGSRRCCSTADQLDRKPGREMVTFLLVCNLAMWAISTFETSRADVHPTQLHFYGIWAWTIISHVSMPLAIFYRFHVTVCLGEIWKRSYKLKQEFIGL